MRSSLPTKPVALARTRQLFLPAAISLLLVVANCGRYEYSLTSEKKPASPAGDRAAGGDWLAAVGELILPLIEEHDSKYAPGYREEVFRALALGATGAGVARLLGRPLLTKQFSDGSTCLVLHPPWRAVRQLFCPGSRVRSARCPDRPASLLLRRVIFRQGLPPVLRRACCFRGSRCATPPRRRARRGGEAG